MATAKLDMEKLVSLCRRRGFIFQSSEIYGGINGFWDYGPLGVELKKNIKDAWWQDMVRNPPPGPDGQEITMVGLDCSIIMNPKVWEASGHVGGFSDPMVACKAAGCKKLLRADQYFVVIFRKSADAETVGIEAQMAFHEFLQRTKELHNQPPSAEREELLAEETRLFRASQPLQKSDYIKTVQAASAEEAKELAKLTSKEQKAFPGATQWGVLPLMSYFQLPYGSPPCPSCGESQLAEPRPFNLMFESHAGAIQSEENKVYLRPETAQGIFVNFRNVLDSTRVKLPFGVAQIGKAFRNEINPRNYTFRSREFEQMEIEFFCHPDESMKWYEYWRDLRKKWYSTLGIKSDNLKPREQGKEELAHYSIGTTDIEYMFPFSEEPQELEGVAHRGNFDLNAHMEKSGADLTYFDEDGWNAFLMERQQGFKDDKKAWEEEKKKLNKEERPKFVIRPHVIEPSAGADRFTLAVLCEAYHADQVPDAKGNLEERLVMKFHPRLAPVKAAIFPLVKKDGMPEKAQALYRELKKHFKVEYDDGGAVGRRYRRQDEIGTPFCITIDGDTLKDDTVTIRDRDTCLQRRVPVSDVLEEIRKALG